MRAVKRILRVMSVIMITIAVSAPAGALLPAQAMPAAQATRSEQAMSAEQATPAAQPSPAAQAGKPRIIVEGCAVEGGGLVSGAVCEVKITLRNMSAATEVTSILVTGRWSNDVVPPVDFETTNQSYVSGIGPTQTRDVRFSLKTKSVNIMAMDTVPMYLDIVYSYDQSPDNTNTVLLQLPVGGEQLERPVPHADDGPALDGFFRRLPISVNSRFVYAGGSALCLFAACISVYRRLRRR